MEVLGSGGWRWSGDRRRTKERSPKQSHAAPREVVALCPAVVQAKKWMEPREQMQSGHKTLRNDLQ